MITAEQISILLFGSAATLFVAWYFFGKSETIAQASSNEIAIKVDAGYSPSQIKVSKGRQVTLRILRTDPSDCLDQIVIPQWSINRTLPLNKEISISFTPDESGEFPFHCGMNMFHGKIIVT